jgi:hypothetical protein
MFHPVDWVMTSTPVYNSELELAMSPPLLVSEFNVPTIRNEQLWIMSIQQTSAPASYNNELLSQENQPWYGNVLVLHECGKAGCAILGWVRRNQTTLRALLLSQR